MAGGKATRMEGVEKAMAGFNGRPMITYVIDALLSSSSIEKIYIALTPRVPQTAGFIATRYRHESRMATVLTPGSGYVEDTAYAAQALGLRDPFLIIAADIPLVAPALIDRAVAEYQLCEAEALSVRIDLECLPPGIEPGFVLEDGGIKNVPAGINIIDGSHMDRYQQEHLLIVRDRELSVNVNYMKDLDLGEKMMGRRHTNR